MSLFSANIVDSDWLARPCLEVAPDLIGCYLVRRQANGQMIRGMIVETEAYTAEDPACHGYRQRTLRNSAMFGAPGTIYVYLIYGMYHCLNISSDRADFASAVLIRALQLESRPAHLQSRDKLHRIAAGPGKLCRALQIDLHLNGQRLDANGALWLEHRTADFAEQLNNDSLVQTTRIGLSVGTELPWRWYLANCPAVSKV